MLPPTSNMNNRSILLQQDNPFFSSLSTIHLSIYRRAKPQLTVSIRTEFNYRTYNLYKLSDQRDDNINLLLPRSLDASGLLKGYNLATGDRSTTKLLQHLPKNQGRAMILTKITLWYQEGIRRKEWTWIYQVIRMPLR